jgi:hypothetical protein
VFPKFAAATIAAVERLTPALPRSFSEVKVAGDVLAL